MLKFVIADVLDLYQIYCLKVPINDWTFVNSFELFEYSHSNLSRFFTVQLSMFFCVALISHRLDYLIRYSVVCQQLFSFYFSPLCFLVWRRTFDILLYLSLFVNNFFTFVCRKAFSSLSELLQYIKLILKCQAFFDQFEIQPHRKSPTQCVSESASL